MTTNITIGKSGDTPALTSSQKRSGTGRIFFSVAIVALIVAMGLGTKLVRVGSTDDARPKAFSAADFGAAEFPKVQAAITARAVDAKTLAAAIAADKAAAAKQYGLAAGIGAEMAVTFTGVVGEGKSGIYMVTVPDAPGVTVRVQTGPAINGTDLRDASGTITFEQFTNQIEYQNAAAALNDALKTEVLAKVDTANLTGKTITVTGAFMLINPKGWLVTPAQLSVQ